MKTCARWWLLFFCGMMLSVLSVSAQEPEVTGQVQARRAVGLVGNAQFREAKELLITLTDGDFRLPPRKEIRGFTKEGMAIGEYVRMPAIGNRRLLLARCDVELGERKEAQDLLWDLLRDDCTAQEFFVLFAREFRDADFAATMEKLKGLVKEDGPGQNITACELAGKYLTVFRALPDGDLRGAVQFIRAGAMLLDTKPRYPVDEFSEWTCAQFAKYPKQTVPILVEAMEKSDQPTWLVRSLGLSGSPLALEPLKAKREKIKNSHARNEIDVAIARIEKANAGGEGQEQ